MRSFTRLAGAAFVIAALAWTIEAAPRPLLLISIDGLSPDYLQQPDKLEVSIPRLRRLMREGTHATGVKGVLPTVTYPSHTTLVTGVSPGKHGIGANTYFDPGGRGSARWYAYAEDIRVPTLWGAASRAGLVVGSVSWPVTVGSADIRYNIPEYAPTRTDEDLKIVRALSNGLLDELAPYAGPYLTDVDQGIPRDWARTRYAIQMIRRKGVQFLTVHLAALDHEQHSHGLRTAAARSTLEELDKMIAALDDAMRSAHPDATVCIVSDHGFAEVSQMFNLQRAFIDAGLMAPKAGEWTAMPWTGGASTAIVMKNANDAAARDRVRRLLGKLAADPANGIAAILDRPTVEQVGGSDAAAFWVDMRPGFTIGVPPGGEMVANVSRRGAHGYSPEHPEMNSVFLIAGKGARPGATLDVMDMRNIAPMLAKVMGIPFPGADIPPSH